MLANTKTYVSWLHQLLRDNRGIRYFLVTLALIVIAGIGLLAFLLRASPVTVDATTAAPVTPAAAAQKKSFSPLTGLEVPAESDTRAPVTAVMIENSPDARPQSGLKGAGVVFEAVAEGGITRFAAVYQGAKPALIGPVRSVRPYYVSWIAPFDASIAHVGGSYNALQEVRNGQYRDIDQFFNPGTYWRTTDRYAPHNVYTDGAHLDALNAAKGYAGSSFTGFTRVAADLADAKKPQGTPAANISVGISGRLYDSAYAYDPASRTYLRSQAGAPHVDREAGQIAPTVVIVMKVETRLAFEDGYREQMSVVGSGEATVFQRSQAFAATWHKADQRGQLSFTDANGQDIALERGQTWITAVDTDRSVQWN